MLVDSPETVLRCHAALTGHQLIALDFFFFFFTLVTGPRRSLSLKLSDTSPSTARGWTSGGRASSHAGLVINKFSELSMMRVY